MTIREIIAKIGYLVDSIFISFEQVFKVFGGQKIFLDLTLTEAFLALIIAGLAITFIALPLISLFKILGVPFQKPLKKLNKTYWDFFSLRSNNVTVKSKPVTFVIVFCDAIITLAGVAQFILIFMAAYLTLLFYLEGYEVSKFRFDGLVILLLIFLSPVVTVFFLKKIGNALQKRF